MSRSYKKFSICVDNNRNGKKKFFKRQSNKKFRRLSDEISGKNRIFRRFYSSYKITDFYIISSKEDYIKFEVEVLGIDEETAKNNWLKYYKRK